MQQYFVNEPLMVGNEYVFTKEQAHHAGDVLHLNHARIRLVYKEKAFFAETYYDGKILKAHLLEEDPESHELPVKIRLAMGLIRREKFELVLQKAAELGVSDIIPLVTERCVVQIKKDKQEKVKQRWQAILQEGAEQCKRNRIPVLDDFTYLKDMRNYTSDLNIVPYEKESVHSSYISDIYTNQLSVTIVIGPEGGFSSEEIDLLKDMQFTPVTLGSRILRAETAAIYTCSVLAEKAERNSRK